MRIPTHFWREGIRLIVLLALCYIVYLGLDFLAGGPFPVARQVWRVDTEKNHSLAFNYVSDTKFHLYIYFPDGDRPILPFSELRKKIVIHWSSDNQTQQEASNISWPDYTYEQRKGTDPLLIGSVGGFFNKSPPNGRCVVTVSFDPDFPWPKRVGMYVIPWYPSP
jgi:hypothetical protein